MVIKRSKETSKLMEAADDMGFQWRVSNGNRNDDKEGSLFSWLEFKLPQIQYSRIGREIRDEETLEC